MNKNFEKFFWFAIITTLLFPLYCFAQTDNCSLSSLSSNHCFIKDTALVASCKLSMSVHYNFKPEPNIINAFYADRYKINFQDSSHVSKFLGVMDKSVQKMVDSLLIYAKNDKNIKNKIKGFDRTEIKSLYGTVNNGTSIIIDDKRYIFININLVFSWLTKDNGITYSTFGLLAHEVSHHILGHTDHRKTGRVSDKRTRKNELEADEMAGLLVAKAFYAEFTHILMTKEQLLKFIDEDANIKRLQQYIMFLPKTASATHPGRDIRLNAFQTGFLQGVKEKGLYW